MVATLVLTLVAEGAVELDDPAVTYLPQLEASWSVDRRITLRHLLSHQSGLHPDLDRVERFGEGDDALDRAQANGANAADRLDDLGHAVLKEECGVAQPAKRKRLAVSGPAYARYAAARARMKLRR